MSAKLIGQCFGRLTVLRQAPSRDNHRHYICLCDCGAEVDVRGTDLRHKGALTCSCLRPYDKHGISRTPEYRVWASMKDRCYNPKNPHYQRYGGRGIKVEDVRWRTSFADFFSDMGRCPSPQHSLDRIDNNRGYCRENCRYTTKNVQRRNSRNIIQVNIDGKIVCLKDACVLRGVSYGLIKDRVIRYGWTIEKALATPKATPAAAALARWPTARTRSASPVSATSRSSVIV